ncbi:MAG: hypothetical protein ACWA6U_05905 [Breznakibacter sp.]
MPEILKIILIVILLVGLVIAYSKVHDFLTLKSLQKRRIGLSKQNYIEALEKKGYPKKDIEVVYEKLKDFIASDRFLLHPDDDIHQDYEITDLDDIELIIQVCDSLGLRYPNDSEYDEVNIEFEKLTASYILSLIEKVKENTAYNT